ncbi:MAG: hypothetical protein WB491_07950 [Candidatus Aquilonibacter sp.]
MKTSNWAFARVLCVVLITAVLAASGTQGASSADESVYVSYSWHNDTKYCAWVTVYWSYGIQATWHIEPGSTRWVRPGGYQTGGVRFSQFRGGPQVKWMAEVRPTGECSGSGGERLVSQVTPGVGSRYSYSVYIRGEQKPCPHPRPFGIRCVEPGSLNLAVNRN